MKGFLYILSLCVVAFCLVACSQSRIPESKMVKICEEMILADCWLDDNMEVSLKADTTLFYEPVLRKYGYTTEDFKAALTYYLANPEKFARVFEKAKKDMDAKIQELMDRPQEEYNVTKKEDND